jgi:hypothetical protein
MIEEIDQADRLSYGVSDCTLAQNTPYVLDHAARSICRRTLSAKDSIGNGLYDVERFVEGSGATVRYPRRRLKANYGVPKGVRSLSVLLVISTAVFTAAYTGFRTA